MTPSVWRARNPPIGIRTFRVQRTQAGKTIRANAQLVNGTAMPKASVHTSKAIRLQCWLGSKKMATWVASHWVTGKRTLPRFRKHTLNSVQGFRPLWKSRSASGAISGPKKRAKFFQGTVPNWQKTEAWPQIVACVGRRGG